jgi:hypothetical protein
MDLLADYLLSRSDCVFQSLLMIKPATTATAVRDTVRYRAAVLGDESDAVKCKD